VSLPITLDVVLWWALRGGLIILLALAASLLLRGRPAAVRHAIWTVAVVGQLLLPVGASLLPARTLELSVPMVRIEPPPQPVDAAALRDTGQPAPATAAPAKSFNPLLLIPLGSALLLLRLIVGTWRVNRLARRAGRIVDGDWLSFAQQQCEALQIARPVTLIRTERLQLPVTWGFVYPTILLPDAARDWSPALRRHVLLHELAHVKRGDALTQLAAQVAMALFWFNPLVWLAMRRMRAEAENACDDYVLRDGERPSVYAATLFQLVRAHDGGTLPAFASLSVGSRSELETRVSAITHPKRDWSIRRAWLGFAVAAMLVIVVPLSAVQRAIGSVEGTRKESSLTPKVARTQASVDCRPLRKLGFDFQQINGSGTDVDGTVTHYFFLLPAPERCIEAMFPEDARFTDDDRDLIAIPGLTAFVREKVGRTDRVLHLSEAGGVLQRRYVVNGTPAAWNRDAETWYRTILPEFIRLSSAGVADRARRIVDREGVEGVVAEIARMPNTSNRRAYLEAVLALRSPGELPREQAIDLARQALGSSEPDVAQFLVFLASREAALAHVRRSVLDATALLDDYSNRNTVLEALARHPDPDVQLAAVESIGLLRGDDWRRSFLE
jgi:beta-lactamase regulating signal transducer with metallopeptidase domain